MGWKDSLKGAFNTAKGAFLTNPLNPAAGFKANRTINEFNTTLAGASNQIRSSYATGRKELGAGFKEAQNTAREGFEDARRTTDTGYDQARGELSSGYDKATGTAREGYKEAKGYYDTPEMVTSRQELYNRVLGKGGMSDDTLEMQKAKAREEYGTGLRSTQDSLNSMYGDSSAEGLTGENLARAAASLGAERANTVRDIDIGNEALKRQEMTGAIGSLQAEAGARAGLSADEAQYISGLEARAGEGLSGLTTQETDALATLAEREGTTLADLQARLATGQAGLTVEEAKALAEITSAQASSTAAIKEGQSMFSGIF